MTRQELIRQIHEKQSFLCVGLDTDLNKIPESLKKMVKKEYEEEEYTYGMLLEFNTRIIDATAPYCVAYKPNLAFYEAYGLDGLAAFESTIEYLKENYPHHFIIADAKRGDIGNTSKMYAKTFFEEYDVDSLTVAPYMGEDSVTPFLGYKDKWVILLALTSNKGSHDFQLIEDAQGERLFEKVLKKSQEWGNDENMRCHTGPDVRRHPQDCAQALPIGSWRRCPGRQLGRGLPLWYDSWRYRSASKLLAWHHLCLTR